MPPASVRPLGYLFSCLIDWPITVYIRQAPYIKLSSPTDVAVSHILLFTVVDPIKFASSFAIGITPSREDMYTA